MSKPIVFISHITEEKEFAEALKKLIKPTYLSGIEIFISSDKDSIEAGSKWLNEIDESLKECIIELVLCSEVSVKRPWINFEAGAGWVRGIPTIPVCHSGMSKGKLPVPLNSLQAVDLTNEEDVQRIFPVISKQLGLDVPKLNLTEFVDQIKILENEYTVHKELVDFFNAIGGCDRAIQKMRQCAYGIQNVNLGLGVVSSEDLGRMEQKITSRIKDYVSIRCEQPGVYFGEGRSITGSVVTVKVNHISEIIEMHDRQKK